MARPSDIGKDLLSVGWREATEDRAREEAAEREPDPLDILAEQELGKIRMMAAALRVVEDSLF